MKIVKSTNRLEWIDSARVFATLTVMVWNITIFTDFSGYFNNSYIYTISRVSVFDGCVAFFFIISGYFAAKKMTWGKAGKRAFWLFIPFFL